LAPRFVLFGPAHLGALAATAALAVGVSLWVRSAPDGARAHIVRYALAALLIGAAAAHLIADALLGVLTWHAVPLHLCDAAIIVAAWALVTRAPAASELLYFWACAGTTLAMITPELWYGFPHWRFFSYFALHGGVVVAALLVTVGLRLPPAPGAPLRAFLWTNAYAAFVGLVNWAFGTNFLFLCEKPSSWTPLSFFGPWPVYLITGEAVALALFMLLYTPFWAARRARHLP
jgi:hypothetical integral membrane protein (TIGR02206 family)